MKHFGVRDLLCDWLNSRNFERKAAPATKPIQWCIILISPLLERRSKQAPLFRKNALFHQFAGILFFLDTAFPTTEIGRTSLKQALYQEGHFFATEGEPVLQEGFARRAAGTGSLSWTHAWGTLLEKCVSVLLLSLITAFLSCFACLSAGLPVSFALL